MYSSDMEPIKIASDSYTLDSLIDDILNKKIKKIIVMAGAGISTPSGIPDFRSPGTGLYNNLSQYDIPYPEAIFEKSYFRENPKPFFTLAKDLIPNIDKYKPNKIHYFLRLLQDKKLLHRLYTQNIDGLESLSGIDNKKLIEAHGSFRTAKCVSCKTIYSGIYVKNEVLKDKVPLCKYGSCSGVVKPDIVFFGDKLPELFYRWHQQDFSTADCVIVMGTSLEVEPFANIIKESHNNAARVLMNKESVGPFKRSKLGRRKDLQLLGDLIQSVDSFVQKLGWSGDLDNLILQETQYIESNKHLMLEKHYYRFGQDTRIFNPCDRVSKTSFDKREKIDAFSRKNPLIETFSTNSISKLKSKNTKITSQKTCKKKVFKAFGKVKKDQNRENTTRKLSREIINQSNEDSSHDSDSDESAIEEKATIINNQRFNEIHNQLKADNELMSDFLVKKYEFQLKLAYNFNHIQSLETKYLNLNLNQGPKQVPNSRFNSVLSMFQENDENKINNNNFNNQRFFKNSLLTANSKPLLAKRVQSGGIERKY